MKKILAFTILFSIMASCKTAADFSGKENSLEKIVMQSEFFEGSSWSYCAGYADAGIPLFSKNMDLRLSFGSVQKILTAAAALDSLGSSWRWETQAFLKKSDKGGYDLVIIGHGDPTIASGSFSQDPSGFSKSLAAWLREKKVDAVGKIILPDENFVSDPKDLIPWADLGTMDSRPGAAFNWADNLVFVKLKRLPGSATTVITGTSPALPAELFDLSGMTKTSVSILSARGRAYPGTEKIFLVGGVPDDGGEYVVRTVFPDPLYAAGLALKTGLIDSGISVNDAVITVAGCLETPAESQAVWNWKSPPLRDVLFVQNKTSSNFITDQTARALARQAFMPVTLEDSALRVLQILKNWGLDTDAVTVYDPTGISRENGLTSGFLFSFFCNAARKPWFDDFLRTLPAPGPREALSPLADFFAGTVLEGRVFIKSGTLIGVRSFSGYLMTRKGRLAAFSFCVNNYRGEKKRIDDVFRAWILELDRLLESNVVN
jgi:D-alanyl-D-alanine carboxypeptidase/D-alanyl-D-alanine-endopeptidase (penicillin-binding protein 4)